MINYLLQNYILHIYVLYYGVLQRALMSTVTVLQLAPMLLQLTRIGGGGNCNISDEVIFHCTT